LGLLLFDVGKQVVRIELAVGYYAAVVRNKLYYLSDVQWVSAAVV
jgi:hypothetical protein